MSLSSLAPDVWSEVLHYLPAPDLSVASTSVSRTLSSDGAGERAAWLAVHAAAQRAFASRPRRTWSEEAQGDGTDDGADDGADDGTDDGADDGTDEKSIEDEAEPHPDYTFLMRYDTETWMGLYRLLTLLAADEKKAEAAVELEPGREGGEESAQGYTGSSSESDVGEEEEDSNAGPPLEDGDDDEREPKSSSVGRPTLVPAVTMWLLFGAPTLPPRSSNANTIRARVVQSLLREVTADEGRGCPVSRTRIIQSALRLGDAGHWDYASEILKAAEVRTEEGGGGGRERGFSSVDAKICAATFLVDRLYANTYVREDEEDSNDLKSAVRMGREAEGQTLLDIRDGTTASRSSGVPSTDAGAVATTIAGPANRATTPPPPVTSLFATDTLRLAAARLALARALALLAQHVGLGVTNLWKGDLDLVGVDSIAALMSGGPDVAEVLFRQGLGLIKSSLSALDAAGATEDSLDHCEVYAATVAARGELLYCAASASTLSFIPLLSRDANGEVGVEQLIHRSIVDLRRSFEIVGKRLTDVEDLTPMVEVWCANAPRSVVLLQSRTAKDLAKTCDFATLLGFPALLTNPDESSQFLNFARAVSVRLLGELHPSTANIERISERHQRREVGEEDHANRWLVGMFGDDLQL